MSQNITHDQTTEQYTSMLNSLWSQWEPALRDTERLLLGNTGRFSDAPEDLCSALRRSQYRAHTVSELVAGLHPPGQALDAHEMLLTTFSNCRDMLGVLAIRAELDELDEHTAEIALGSISSTRDAFRSVRHSTSSAWQFRGNLEPLYMNPMPEAPPRARALTIAMWSLVAACAVLFMVLALEIFLLVPNG